MRDVRAKCIARSSMQGNTYWIRHLLSTTEPRLHMEPKRVRRPAGYHRHTDASRVHPAAPARPSAHATPARRCPAAPTQGAARGSAATDIRIASAICCAIASWIATEMRWQTKGMNVRVDHVASSYSESAEKKN